MILVALTTVLNIDQITQYLKQVLKREREGEVGERERGRERGEGESDREREGER